LPLYQNAKEFDLSCKLKGTQRADQNFYTPNDDLFASFAQKPISDY
jgi:hypothetical protein